MSNAQTSSMVLMCCLPSTAESLSADARCPYSPGRYPIHTASSSCPSYLYSGCDVTAAQSAHVIDIVSACAANTGQIYRRPLLSPQQSHVPLLRFRRKLTSLRIYERTLIVNRAYGGGSNWCMCLHMIL